MGETAAAPGISDGVGMQSSQRHHPPSLKGSLRVLCFEGGSSRWLAVECSRHRRWIRPVGAKCRAHGVRGAGAEALRWGARTGPRLRCRAQHAPARAPGMERRRD